MFVIKVMPIARGAFKDHLSFFAKEALEPGMVVDVPVRNRTLPALVLEARNAREEKTQLRSESYTLKKLAPKKIRRIFPQTTIAALQEVARYHAVSDGVVLAHFSPSAIIGSEKPIAEAAEDGEQNTVAVDRLALQGEREERIRTYRNTTRESFAQGASVMIVSPTIPEAEKLYEELSRGIEEQTVLLTSNVTKKGAVTAWNRAVTDPEPLLLIVTTSFLALPRENIGTIFIERESARSYTARERPHLDTRLAAEQLAQKRGSRIVFADFPLRIETHARLQNQDLEEFTRLQRSMQGAANIRIIDTRTKDEPTIAAIESKKKKFSPLAPHIQTLITQEIQKGNRMFVYSARRGIAPLTVCNDCDTPITDPTTGAPMTLHKTERGNVFLSFRSGAIVPATTSCRECGGWNLVSLGIGVERVHDEVKKLFPNVPTFLLTAESAKTHAAAKKLIKQFYGTPGAILIGTDRALPYLYEPVEYSIVASLDSMLSSSAWRANTNALHTLFYLRDKTLDSLYVQTRLPDTAVMRAAAANSPADFIAEEMEERKQFGFPPFATFVGITWTGTERAVQKNAELVTERLTNWELVGPLPPRAVSKNRYLGRAVIRLEKDTWPDEALVHTLKSLPPEITITIDPDEIV